jgi:hypothetical protein
MLRWPQVAADTVIKTLQTPTDELQLRLEDESDRHDETKEEVARLTEESTRQEGDIQTLTVCILLVAITTAMIIILLVITCSARPPRPLISKPRR